MQINYKKLFRDNPSFYFLKICEELAELQVAVLHKTQNKASYEDVVEEIADVQIQLEKVIEWLSHFDDSNKKNINHDIRQQFIAKQQGLL